MNKNPTNGNNIIRNTPIRFSKAASLILQLLGALSYLIVLPEEWDASFNKALPILIDGEYVEKKHENSIRRVLTAAALTYFAAALADMLNIGRWILILLKR